MATGVTANQPFNIQLRADLDELDVSVRELARRLNPENPEGARSGIHKWLRGDHFPSRSSRRQVAQALGFTADRYLDDVAAMPPFDLAAMEPMVADLMARAMTDISERLRA